jgi:plastocyanin
MNRMSSREEQMTTRNAIRLLTVGATVAAVAAIPATAGAATPVLKAEVGPGFTITLKDAKNKSVKTLKAGKYTIKVADKSDFHNFHLIGPGVDKDSGVPGTKTTTWKVTLKKGSYTFVCDPHASSMKGTFTVS